MAAGEPRDEEARHPRQQRPPPPPTKTSGVRSEAVSRPKKAANRGVDPGVRPFPGVVAGETFPGGIPMECASGPPPTGEEEDEEERKYPWEEEDREDVAEAKEEEDVPGWSTKWSKVDSSSRTKTLVERRSRFRDRHRRCRRRAAMGLVVRI